MKILVTNDDGILAPGLAALVEVAQLFGEVTVVAPALHMSGCSHAATTESPLQIFEHGARRYSVGGTPVDCVRLGLLRLARETTLVLSGVNDGGNLGVDVLMSGTVAAAREAGVLGRPAIAISQYRKRGRLPDWHRSARFAAEAIRALVNETALAETSPGTYWNVNLPDVDLAEAPPAIRCQPDPHPLPICYEDSQEGVVLYRTNYHDRPRLAGSDVEVCFSGNISVSQMTHDIGLWNHGRRSHDGDGPTMS